MAELRKDLVRDNWVVIANDRALKPSDFPINRNGVNISGNNTFCPFCEGNEAYTTNELSAFRKDNSKPDGPGWTVRTVPNKFSAFQLQGELDMVSTGIYKSCNGIGQHEVVIETPEHGVEFHDFSVDRIILVYRMLKQRYRELAGDSRIKYIQIYKNRGLFAGASLQHSHSQILAFPVVPDQNKGIPKYFNKTGQCLICDILEQEKEKAERVIYESNYFLVLCPYASRFSYESWIVPKRHTEHFSDISDEEIEDLADVIKGFFTAMLASLDDPSYNIMINTAPVNVPYQGGYHWYMEITPRLLIANAAELSSGYYMNPVSPEISAQIIREKMKKIGSRE
ncbi:MAG: HIT domain-containing protein [Syntrophomonadaceae bacterium]|nr:HIT domain-containing protein [Syntrophomonadaceae bacterium]